MTSTTGIELEVCVRFCVSVRVRYDGRLTALSDYVSKDERC